jgi:hypothetical protein
MMASLLIQLSVREGASPTHCAPQFAIGVLPVIFENPESLCPRKGSLQGFPMFSTIQFWVNLRASS